MKYLALVIVLSINICFAQEDYPTGTKYITTIASTEYQGKDTTNYRVIHKYYDSLHNILENENTLSTALQENSTSTVVSQTDYKFVAADIDENGDTLSMRVYLYDENGNRTHNYQIKIGDTLVSQKRIYDQNGNCLKLYTSSFYSDKTCTEWKYDTNGNCIIKIEYDRNDRPVNKTKYENEYDLSGELLKVSAFTTVGKKGYRKHYIETHSANSLRRDSFYNVVGYNYGIKMITVKGGYRLEKYFENGDMKSMGV